MNLDSVVVFLGVPQHQEILGDFIRRFQSRQLVLLTPKRYERFLSING